MGSVPQSVTTDRYTIRPVEPGDVASFLSLYESVWTSRYDDRVRLEPTRAWFDWKYGSDNPFYDEPPIVVAEVDGDVVGAKPHVPIRLRAHEETPLALVGTDTMVHEAHRGRGLFGRMIDQTLRRYADREPALTYNFPNEQSLPGYRTHGWYVLSTTPTTAYRIQQPSPFVRRYGGSAGAVAAPVADVLARGGTALLDTLRQSFAGVTVEKNPPRAAEQLGALHSAPRETRLHVERDATFYRWLLDEPLADGSPSSVRSLDRSVYIGYRGTEPVAGAVVDTADTGDDNSYRRLTNIVDVAPLAGEIHEPSRREVLAAVLADARDAQVVRAPTMALSPRTRRRLGFVSESNPLLSPAVFRGGPLALRPLGDEFTAGGITLTDPENWLVTNAERW